MSNPSQLLPLGKDGLLPGSPARGPASLSGAAAAAAPLRAHCGPVRGGKRRGGSAWREAAGPARPGSNRGLGPGEKGGSRE